MEHLKAEWKHVLMVLKEAQKRLEATGERHTWMTGAIDIAERNSKELQCQCDELICHVKLNKIQKSADKWNEDFKKFMKEINEDDEEFIKTDKGF